MLHQVVNIFHFLEVSVLQKGPNILLCILLEKELGSSPKTALLSLDYSSLVYASPPFPDQQLFEPALWNSGKVMEAEAYSLKTKSGGHRKSCVPRSPTVTRLQNINGKKKKKIPSGVPLWHSGLRILHCHCSSSGHCCDTGLIPRLGIYTCYRWGQQNKTEQKNDSVY